MATFQGDSTDDEIGVNLQLAERLSINRGDHATSSNRILTKKEQKQLCNQRKKKLYRDEQSSSSSSLEMQNDPSSSRMSNVYSLHNKKRQNGDKNIEQLANPKRTCLGDRFGGSPDRKDHKLKANNTDVKYVSRMANFPSQPLNLTKRNIFPDKTYEDHLNKFSDEDDSDFEPFKSFSRKKNLGDGEMSRSAKRQGASTSSVQPTENQPSVRHKVQFVDSTSDDDSRTIRQNGALKGGRQSPDPMSFKKVQGRKVKKVNDSDDTDDDCQVKYRRRPLLFSSDSDDSGPSEQAVSKKPVDAALKKSANLSFSSGDSFNSNHDLRYKPDMPFMEMFNVDSPSSNVQTMEPSTSNCRVVNPMNKSYNTCSSLRGLRDNRTNGPTFMNVPLHDFDPYILSEEEQVMRRTVMPHFASVPIQYKDSLKRFKDLPFVPPTMEPEMTQPFQTGFLNSLCCTANNRSPSHSSYGDFRAIPNNTHSLQDRDIHPVNEDGSSLRTRGTIPKITRHRRTHSSKSAKGRSVGGSQKGKSNLSARYPDLFDAEDSSEVEFFTANSYSDTESNTESLTNLRRANGLRNPPVRVQEVCDSINVGSSEDEISVVYTSVRQPSRNSEQRRGTPRTLGRRYNRGSRRHISNTQDVISLSPDPVEQVRQMEEDERFARMLQAQFDAEADPTYSPPVRRSPDPCQITMREPSSSDEDSIDLDVFPRSSARILAMGHPFSIIPTVVTRRGSFRTRRPDTRNRRRWAADESWNLSRLFHSAPLHNLFSFESSDDSYEAFWNLTEINGGDVTFGLEKTEINRLPTRKYTTPNGASSSQGTELLHKRAELNKECQVCLSDYVNGDVLRILPCFHEFHTPCIDPWLKINNTCPVCRVTVDLGEYE